MRLARTILWAAMLSLSSVSLTSGQAQDVVEYVITDALGNVRVVQDERGNVIERHDYLPFGEECTTGPCAANPGVGAGQPRKFTGKERDAETGLDYFGARYYRANTGRFTTVDPVYTIEENLVDPQRWNRYAYTRNNPLRYTDTDGRVIKLLYYAGKAAHAAYKGYDIYSTVEGITESTGTIFSGDAAVGTGDRLLATGSLLSEISGASDVLKAAKGLGIAQDALNRDASRKPEFLTPLGRPRTQPRSLDAKAARFRTTRIRRRSARSRIPRG